MKILQITSQHKLRSGGGIQMQRLACSLKQRGHHVHAIYGFHSDFQDDFKIFSGSGVHLDFLEMDESFRLDQKTLTSIHSVRNILKKKKFDIVHTHAGSATDIVFAASLGLDVNIIVNRGMSCPLDFWNSFKYRSSKIKKIIAVSKRIKEIMVKTGKISSEKINVVYGGVDTVLFSPLKKSSLRSELSIPDHIKIIGYAGSSLHRKGLSYLFDAFKIVLQHHKNYILVLAGVNREEFNLFHVDSSVAEYTYPIGFRKDVNNCLAGFDLFVFPGIMDEGLTGTVREAMATGLPVISTDVGGNREIITEDIGVLVPPRDAERLSKAMRFLIENPKIAGDYGKNARDFVLKNMTDQIRCEKIEEIYFSLL
jgi:glycosyltransferase involved in cell wall biosynthesis